MTVICLGHKGESMKNVDALGRYTPLSVFSSCTAGLDYTWVLGLQEPSWALTRLQGWKPLTVSVAKQKNRSSRASSHHGDTLGTLNCLTLVFLIYM